jgi:signal transduction histidine kinase
MLRAMLLTFVILGAIAYVPCLWLSVRERLWLVAGVDTLVYGFVVYLHFARLSYRPAVLGLLSVTFLLSVVLLVVLGPFGAGDLWLFAFPILAGVLAGIRPAIVALALNLVTLVAIGFALQPLARLIPSWADRSPAGWAAIVVNFLLLDAVVTVLLAMMVNRLDRALAHVQETSAHLDAERRELLNANERLRLEIEDRQKAEQRRNDLEKQLLHAQKLEAVGRLAGGIAHDFNNLLTAILGYTDLLSQKLAGRSAREELTEIRRAAGRAADLTRQLLAFGRKQVLQTQVLTLSASVHETEKMLRRIIGENIELETVTGGESGRVCADPGQIEQVIVNLAINARDAMPHGGTLTIRTADAVLGEEEATRLGVPPGAYVEMSVADTGMGMDALTLSRVFEPFFTTKEVGHGTGLGLATVYGIVKQSGGQIVAESTVGQGTRFRLLLPRIDARRGRRERAAAHAHDSRAARLLRAGGRIRRGRPRSGP